MENLFLNSTNPINVPSLVNKLMDLNSSFPKIAPSSSIGGKKKRSNNKRHRIKMKSIRKKNNKKKNNKTRKNFK